MSGLWPQLLPIALLHSQRVVINLLHLLSMSNRSSANHFTGCVVEGTLNIHECSISESFKVQLVLNQIHRFAQGSFGRVTGPVAVLSSGSYRGCICPRVSPPFLIPYSSPLVSGLPPVDGTHCHKESMPIQ